MRRVLTRWSVLVVVAVGFAALGGWWLVPAWACAVAGALYLGWNIQ